MPDLSDGEELVKVHDIGEIRIVEYRNREGETQFRVGLEQQAVTWVFDDLEEAVLYAIACRRRGDGNDALITSILWTFNMLTLGVILEV